MSSDQYLFGQRCLVSDRLKGRLFYDRIAEECLRKFQPSSYLKHLGSISQIACQFLQVRNPVKSEGGDKLRKLAAYQRIQCRYEPF